MPPKGAANALELPDLPIGPRQPEVFLSISQITAIDGRTRETVSRRLDEAGLQPAAKRGGWPVYKLRDVWHVMVRGGTAGGGDDPDKLDPHSRRAHYQAEQAKRNLDIEARRLLRAEDVEEEVARRDKLVATTLDTIPDVLERDCGLTAAQIDVVEKHLDKLRTALADTIQSTEEPAPQPAQEQAAG